MEQVFYQQEPGGVWSKDNFAAVGCCAMAPCPIVRSMPHTVVHPWPAAFTGPDRGSQTTQNKLSAATQETIFGRRPQICILAVCRSGAPAHAGGERPRRRAVARGRLLLGGRAFAAAALLAGDVDVVVHHLRAARRDGAL